MKTHLKTSIITFLICIYLVLMVLIPMVGWTTFFAMGVALIYFFVWVFLESIKPENDDENPTNI